MLRKSTLRKSTSILCLAVATLASAAVARPAVAGDYGYGCGGCEQFYVVNHGPTFTGPAVVLAPNYFDFADPPVVLGHAYWYGLRHHYGAVHYWPAEMLT